MPLKNKNNGTTIFFIFLTSIILATLLARIGGVVHKYFWGEGQCSLFLVPCDSDREIQGFVYLYILFLTTFSFIFLKNKTSWKVYIYGTLIFWMGGIWIILTEKMTMYQSENIGTLVIMFISSILGYFIALGVNKTMGYSKNRNNS